MKRQYLYGASVQGIQSFIFKTNQLRDIVDASAVVERICMDEGLFKPFEEEGGQSVIRAAGNVRYIFATREACEHAVLEFPKQVMQHAPGITLSQAVVEIAEDADFREASDELERKLRVQRNKPVPDVRFGLLGMSRSRRTGLPEAEQHNASASDAGKATRRLCDKMFGDIQGLQARTSNNINEFVGQNDWIAIIHADGNGLGQVVQKMGSDKDTFSAFSKKLDEATRMAAQRAFASLDEGQQRNSRGFIPLRPVVLGGDDLTIVCRGDVALPFAEAYIRCFEEETSRILGKALAEHRLFGPAPCLTACAGVAFIKSSYPFHYGYELAESLCSQAKADAKRPSRLQVHDGLAPSCLMFYKVQDSFAEDFRSIERRELIPCPGHTFRYGPYYLHEEPARLAIGRLMALARQLNESDEANAVKSALRRWLTALHTGAEIAAQQRKRAYSMCPTEELKALFDCATRESPREDGMKASLAYDLLAYHTIVSQKTK